MFVIFLFHEKKYSKKKKENKKEKKKKKEIQNNSFPFLTKLCLLFERLYS